MTEESDICEVFPAMRLEDTLKKEAEDGTEAPAMTSEDSSGKLKKEVEDESQAPSMKLKEEVEDRTPAKSVKKKKKKKKQGVEEGTLRKLRKKKKQEVEDGSQAPAMTTLEDTLKKDVEDGSQAPSTKLKEKVEDGTKGKPSEKKKRKKKEEVKDEEWKKFLGVKKSAGMFSAQIRNPPSLGGYRVWLGTYKSPKVAALAYDQAAYKLHGSQATLNFPDRIRTSDDK